MTNTEETAQALGSIFIKEDSSNTDTVEESGVTRNSAGLVIDENIVMNKLVKLKVNKAQ